MSSKDKVQKWSEDAWTGLVGTRIVLQARKMGDVFVVKGSHRHQTQEVVGRENARAWIEIPLRMVAERKK